MSRFKTHKFQGLKETEGKQILKNEKQLIKVLLELMNYRK